MRHGHGGSGMSTGVTTRMTTGVTAGVTTRMTTRMTAGVTTGVTTRMTAGVTTRMTTGVAREEAMRITVSDERVSVIVIERMTARPRPKATTGLGNYRIAQNYNEANYKPQTTHWNDHSTDR
jgi:hypothetical protein